MHYLMKEYFFDISIQSRISRKLFEIEFFQFLIRIQRYELLMEIFWARFPVPGQKVSLLK